ncbi:2-polyprenyl-6-methoxyphenol hydroxylase-like FAD-dependent oxidoreductase [Arthrobacter stackebrandtii]|uniref:2-polyprenyl-6-methoxyphenol hydroxylase-like FAD-dependent oxidoreductase n=1 Tax=Arthrobacter stackebrandtii TaxID=272161 RepID=A0ABS4YSJ6_9MICC|nr:NAD(P)/FAD-dependent oxidoreductase [Arthrobacter stackebrandtii]MBP2411372.1 2-polyprenyl-6-methoxyphenol hydroxylase-like FAD-dependent oxidoreductase [Arthrobacter stackebrandtii]PYH00335.1 FAD-dependent monooxygenase [Arthrobacter stackebrandtii]
MLDVAVVGAGPVGLHLGALLLQAGLSVRILEQLPAPRPDSRAIGIHPPALAALGLAGVAEPLLAAGVQVHSGVARSGGAEVGRLRLSPPVLTLKQARTEAVLAARVHSLDPQALVRGFRVTSLRDGGSFVTLSGSPAAGAGPGGLEATGARHIQARLVVGADGAHSAVRRLLGIPTGGRDHPDKYLMGDFPDTGCDGATAVLYLEPGGIVESFPLPDGLRRWVVHTDSLLSGAGAAELAGLIHERTGIRVDAGANSMLSAFGVRTRLARSMVSGRAVLVGDAAHEISPIGGQGMNLGWLDAAALAPIIEAALQGSNTGRQLAGFERDRMRAARAAARQAQLNMVLGRAMPPSHLQLRNSVLGRVVALRSAHDLVAGRFTMQSRAVGGRLRR